jgi:hypothetical protein
MISVLAKHQDSMVPLPWEGKLTSWQLALSLEVQLVVAKAVANTGLVEVLLVPAREGLHHVIH